MALANTKFCLYIYLLKTYDLSLGNILNKQELIRLYSVKWFQVLLPDTNSFSCTQIVSSNANSNKAIKHY